MKIHLHSEQFDNHLHAECGRTDNQKYIVGYDVFEATDPTNRCSYCSNYWFPNGQPEYHLEASKQILKNREY